MFGEELLHVALINIQWLYSISLFFPVLLWSLGVGLDLLAALERDTMRKESASKRALVKRVHYCI